MDTKSPFYEKIRKLLQVNTAMSLKQLRDELGNRPRSSLFRDLKKLDLITSYTHAGQYHALKSMARFDDNGLWFFKQVCFAKDGTLKQTMIQAISNAQIGMTQKELKSLLRVKVQNTLTNLIRSKDITRQYLPDHVYVYLCVDKHEAERQLKSRMLNHSCLPNVSLPPESIIIEVLIEIIHTSGHIDAKALAKRLRKRGIVIAHSRIVYVLAHYNIKKKRITKS